MPSWVPPVSSMAGKDIESRSILGPFFRFSPLTPTEIKDVDIFDKPIKEENEAYFCKKLRTWLHPVQKGCHDILMNLLRKSETKPAVLEWISAALTRNEGRDKKPFAIDSTVCNDGFLFNFALELLKIFEPFTDLELKRDKAHYTGIDPSFLFTSERLKTKEIPTAIAMTSKGVMEYAAQVKERADPKKSANFITETFFATTQVFQLGIFRAFSFYTTISDSDANDNQTKLKTRFQAVLRNPEFLSSAFQFFNLTAAFLLKVASGSHIVPSKLPLPTSPPLAWSSLPEHILEGTLDFLTFVLEHDLPVVENQSTKNIINLFTTMIACPTYITNPHLRIKVVDTLRAFSPRPNAIHRLRTDPFTTSLLAQNFLGQALINFFVQIERTGASSQFFDKFSARLYVTLIIHHIWKIETYKLSFMECLQKPEITDSFINMLLNDISYLLDEAFSSLVEIHIYQQLVSSGAFEQLRNSEKEEKKNAFTQAEKMVKSHFIYAGESLRMMSIMTKDMASAFMNSDASCTRIAQTLSTYLVKLAGPRRSDFTIQNPQKYGFNAKWLLKKIAMMFLNFTNFPSFVTAVAGSGHSFQKKVFVDAGLLLFKTQLISQQKVASFNEFLESVAKSAEQLVKAEEELGEIPEEFLDPLLNTLMRDPVRLPSGTTVDRETIRRHLLTTPNDPFNRAPLTVDQLVSNVELKAKIDAFVELKRSK